MAARSPGSSRSALSLRRRESTMPTYRAYLISGDNRVSSYRVIDVETDSEALTVAHQFIDGCDVEVWYLDRKIGRLERGIRK